MKQNTTMIINLRNFTNDDHPFGNIQGKSTFKLLSDFIESHPQYTIFGISLAEIEATDASFPRESVVALAKQLRGEKGFFLIGFNSRDLIDNWAYAAKAKEQPLVIWMNDDYELIGGADITSSTRILIDFVLKHRSVTASKVANALELTVQNASTRLKNLANQGFIMRSEEVAASGGIEYIYHAIR